MPNPALHLESQLQRDRRRLGLLACRFFRGERHLYPLLRKLDASVEVKEIFREAARREQES